MNTDWFTDAHCRSDEAHALAHKHGVEHPIDLFVPTVGSWHSTRRQRAALSLCARCSVRDVCAEFAIDNAEPIGVWGGMTERERARELRNRRNPRPPERRLRVVRSVS